MKIVLRDNYPEPTLRNRNGWYLCQVNVPTDLFFLFGVDNKKRRTLKTSDEAVAKRKLWKVANEIYDEFDRKQIEFAEAQEANAKTEERQLDDQAKKYIVRFAACFKTIKLPDLTPNTPVAELLKAMTHLDTKRDIITDEYPDPDTDEGKEMLSQLQNMRNNEERHGTIRLSTGFTVEHYRAQMRYRSMAVHTFWQDLLINAANQEGIEPPILDEPDPSNFIKFSKENHEAFIDQIIEDYDLDPSDEEDAVILEDLEELSANFDTDYRGYRPRQTDSPRPKQLTTFYNAWDKRVLRDYENESTQNKLKRGIRNFQSAIGDMVIDQVEPHHAYKFLDALLEDRPNVSKSTLSTNIWGCQAFFNFLIEDTGALKTNPFNRINLRKRGVKPVEWQRYETDELYTIFQYPWTEDQRLLLAILVTTGMRLEEAVELTWERYNDTDYQGIKYFSLLSTGEEDPQVKTDSSARYVILHPALDEMLLPRKQESGRLFTWAHNHAGEEINPVLKELFNHPRKRIHSFRRTFKILYRDHGVDEKSIDALVGHAEGDKMRKAYGGVGVPKRYENLCKVEHPWLKARS